MTVLQHEVDVANATAESQYPDDFHTATIGAFAATDSAPIIGWVTDRDTYIDSVTFRMSGVSTANNDIQVSWVASGTAPSAANLAGNVATVAFNTTDVDGSGGNAATNTVYQRKGIEGSNRVPAGSLVCIRWGGQAAVPTGVTNFVATVRYRSRPA